MSAEEDWGLDPFDESAEPTNENPEGAAPLRFDSLPAFVEQYLVMVYRRDMESASIRWCTEWFRHAEAIGRLEALWRAWELLRLDPGEGASNWWLGHCDPHMRVLLSETGPFRNCKKGKHAEDRSVPLSVEPIPATLRAQFGME